MTCHVPDTTPYPWPWDGDCSPERTALVVCGWDGHWAAATRPDPVVLANVADLAAVLPRTIVVAHRPPVRTTVTAGPPPPPIAAGELVELHAEGIDAFWGSPLDALLRRQGLDHLVLAGLGLETTVHSTMRTANDMGLECLVAVDACAAVDPSITPASVSSIEMSGGIFGAVGTTAAVVATHRTPSNPTPTHRTPTDPGSTP